MVYKNIPCNYGSLLLCNISRYPKTSSVESDQSSIQEFPLDLSMRSSMSSTSTSENISASGTSKYLFPLAASNSSRRHPMLSSSSSHSYRSLSSESGSKVIHFNQNYMKSFLMTDRYAALGIACLYIDEFIE